MTQMPMSCCHESPTVAPEATPLRLSDAIAARLVCPYGAHAALSRRADRLVCLHPECQREFPVHDGMPVLINEERSLFRLGDFEVAKRTTLDLRAVAERGETLPVRLKSLLSRAIPGLSHSTSDFDADAALAAIETERPGASILVIGAGDCRYEVRDTTTIVYTDVARGALTQAIVDAHDLPFADASFDAIISVAVLQYLPDPQHAMREAHRVLKPGGLAYVVAPFMQQNTLGPFDFFLFTHTGLRRVMRNFSEVRSGVANGPAMALAWSIEAFATSFSERRWMRSLLSTGVRLLFWPLKYLDRSLSRKRGAYDAASAFYFLGRRAETPLADRDITAGYRGLRWWPSESLSGEGPRAVSK